MMYGKRLSSCVRQSSLEYKYTEYFIWLGLNQCSIKSRKTKPERNIGAEKRAGVGHKGFGLP